jgi:transposase
MTNHFAVNDVCCVSLELSKSTWVCAFASPESGRASVHKMRACDVDRLLRILETGRARAMREVSRSLEIVLCYEVGYDGFWLARLLMARGIRTIVFDPASFLKPRRGRLAKTDRLDAEEMTRILRSWLSGDHAIATAGAFPRSRRKMPSVSSVSARTLLRSGLVSSAG